MESSANIRTKKIDGVIWNTIIHPANASLIIDVRDEESEKISYFELNIHSMDISPIDSGETSWWSSIEGYDGHLIISEYQNKDDPNQKRFFKLYPTSKVEIRASEIPKPTLEILQPFLYEEGTQYFETVSQFLGLSLPCSCEYLEIDNKITLSYYLRSDNGFDRYLLILEDGKKVLKVVQDAEMNGFASGAFFVLEKNLIFVRNRNEICIYAL